VTAQPATAVAQPEVAEPRQERHLFVALGNCRRPQVERYRDVFAADERDSEAVVIAKAICHGCPVRPECRTWADETRPPGIWAGETWAERTRRTRMRRRDQGGTRR